ncbi:alkaline phosphatase [Conexibacter woesei]|uniref:6-phosphatase n=1 Tax=Conexibacter woesei (strain DSM 14684 / CCUG 47730 / CIP 108061 / JCM 11494 / NBRC 100937 / ID131577) TaxID=469383 RepID=D3F1R6_CONWI|nr:alkaline phosphatase [Conexibacter woesei]ADB54097.1 6-phosphatase [Conexibacter woesei DSM 14684]
MKRPTRTLALATVLALAGGATATALTFDGKEDRSAAVASAIDPSTPKNVILLIGDGMGESEITAARNYVGVTTARLNMDTIPFRGVATTYAVNDAAATRPNFVTDSAGGGSQWSTGRKTLASRISQAPTDDPAVPGTNAGYDTALEIAKRLGKRTGNVTTSEVTDATPAAMSAHISERDCKGPEATRTLCPQETKAAGGLGSIAEQQIDLRMDVLLGGGGKDFRQTLDGSARTVFDYAAERGFRRVANKDELAAITSLDGGPVLGVFDDGIFEQQYNDDRAKRLGEIETIRCDETHGRTLEPHMPQLSEMTQKAIDLLESPSGFFLQVEGASIDKQAHTAAGCGQIGELIAFDEAIGVALRYQREHPDTLVVVAADHAHAGLIVSPTTDTTAGPPGYSQIIVTRDGTPMMLTYGTAGGVALPQKAKTQQHTGSAVPVMAIGPQAANVSGAHDLTDLFPLISFQRTPSELEQPETVTVTQTTTVPGPATTTTVPGPATTVPGPERTVERPGPAAAPKLVAGVAAPPRVRVAELRAGLPLTLVATRDGRARVELTDGSGRTLARKTVAVRADRAAATRLAVQPRGDVRRVRVRVTVSAGGQRAQASASVAIGR